MKPTELEKGEDYFVGSLKELKELIRRLNPEIKSWVIVAEEDFRTLQEENLALMEHINKSRGKNGIKRKT